MSQNFLVLALMFGIELVGLVAYGMWGWAQGGWLRWPLVIALPLIAALVWSSFRMHGSPQPARFYVPGPVRLLIEFAFFALAIGGLLLIGQTTFALIFTGLVVLEYALAYDRVIRLLRNTPAESSLNS